MYLPADLLQPHCASIIFEVMILFILKGDDKGSSACTSQSYSSCNNVGGENGKQGHKGGDGGNAGTPGGGGGLYSIIPVKYYEGLDGSAGFSLFSYKLDLT